MPNESTSPTPPSSKHWLIGLGAGCVGMISVLAAVTPPWKGAAAKAQKLHHVFGVEESVQVGLWYGAVGLLIFFALLLVAMRWWLRWTVREEGPAALSTRPQGRWQWIAFVGAMVLAAALRLPSANEAILWDEHDNLRRNFHGFTAMDAKPGTDPWHEAGYREAFFENERANNPFFYSVLAHASLDVWRAVTGTPRDRFNVVPMRIPALIFGLLGIATVWGLGYRLGGPWVAASAALLCALHPLHIRYSVEARGYSIVLWLAPLFLSQSWEILRTGRWRQAFGVSFTAAGLLYAFLGGVYFIALGGLALAAILLFIKKSKENTATLIRLCVAGSLALAVLVFLLLPGLVQALRTLESQFQKNGLPAPWFAQTWHWMTVGLHNPMEHEYFILRDGQLPWLEWLKQYFSRTPVTFVVALGLIPLLLVTGSRTLWRQGAAGIMILFIAFGAPASCLVHHVFKTHYSIFQWYMIYAMPALIPVAAMGLVQLLGGLTSKSSWGPKIAWAGLLGTFVIAIYPPVDSRIGGYTPWPEDTGLPTAHSTFTRGTNKWVTYADGRVLRLGKVSQSTAP